MGFENRDYYRDDSSFRTRYGFTAPTPGCMAVMIACVAVFVLQNVLIVEGRSVATDWLSLQLSGGRWLQLWRWVTYQYAHASGIHIFFNLLGLYFFYPPLERRWGPAAAFAFYTAGGIAAGIAFALLALVAGPLVPLVGASGSILAALGACAFLFPETTLLLFFFPVPIRLAAVLLGLLFALTALGDRDLSNAAHLGGLIFGFALAANAGRLFDDLPRKIAERRNARAAEQIVATEAEIDRILAKVSASGMHSLTRGEQRTLRDATARQKREPAGRS